MKKVFVFMMATVVALGLASCSKMEDPAKPIEISDSDERSAVIEGTLLCVTDLKASPNKYEAAEGVEIVAVIPYAQILAPDTTVAGNWIKKIATDAAGHFTLNVPANPAGVTVKFRVSEKRGKQKDASGDDHNGKWTFEIDDQKVVSGQRLILPIVNDKTKGKFTEIKEKGDEA